MVMIDSQELKAVLMPIADDLRQKIGQGNLSTVAEAHYSSMQTILHIMLSFIHNAEKEGVPDMNKLKEGLVVRVVTLSEIPTATRSSETQDAIQELVGQLEDLAAKVKDPRKLPAFEINAAIKKYNNFNNVLTNMKKAKKVSEDIKVRKAGSTFFLAKTELPKS